MESQKAALTTLNPPDFSFIKKDKPKIVNASPTQKSLKYFPA